MHQENRRELPNVCKDIAACAILHNIARDKGMPDINEPVFLEPEPLPLNYEGIENSFLYRAHLIQNVFNHN